MKKSLSYSAITLAVTLVIGQILLILFSEGNSIGSSVLFILMNLTPMFVAIAFAKSDGQKAVLKDMFLQRESIYSYILAIGSVCVYYGVSFIMGNKDYQRHQPALRPDKVAQPHQDHRFLDRKSVV